MGEGILSPCILRYLSRFDLALKPSEEDTRHWLLHRADSPTEQVVWTYVVEETDTGAITDFVSFYLLESLVLQNPKDNRLRAAYLSYYASELAWGVEDDKFKERLMLLVNDAIILAKRVRVLLRCLSILWSEADYPRRRKILTFSTL